MRLAKKKEKKIIWTVVPFIHVVPIIFLQQVVMFGHLMENYLLDHIINHNVKYKMNIIIK